MSRPVFAAIALAVSALTLAGCAPSLPIGPGSLEEAIEQETGGQVDLGSGASVPSDWPAELPLPEGRLITSISSDGTQVLTYAIADVAVAERLVAALESAGFTEQAKADYGELVTVVLDRDGWAVTVGWVISDDGVTLSYASAAH